MSIEITLDDRKVQRMLRELPDRIERKVLGAAIGPATTPALKAARRLAPVDTGTLKLSLAKKIKTYTETNTAVCLIGPKKQTLSVFKGKAHKPAKYSHLVEGGTKPHTITITLKDGRKLTLNHPGAKANPFLEKAQAAALSQFQSICKRRMAEGVIKEGQKLGL